MNELGSVGGYSRPQIDSEDGGALFSNENFESQISEDATDLGSELDTPASGVMPVAAGDAPGWKTLVQQLVESLPAAPTRNVDITSGVVGKILDNLFGHQLTSDTEKILNWGDYTIRELPQFLEQWGADQALLKQDPSRDAPVHIDIPSIHVNEPILPPTLPMSSDFGGEESQDAGARTKEVVTPAGPIYSSRSVGPVVMGAAVSGAKTVGSLAHGMRMRDAISDLVHSARTMVIESMYSGTMSPKAGVRMLMLFDALTSKYNEFRSQVVARLMAMSVHPNYTHVVAPVMSGIHSILSSAHNTNPEPNQVDHSAYIDWNKYMHMMHGNIIHTVVRGAPESMSFDFVEDSPVYALTSAVSNVLGVSLSDFYLCAGPKPLIGTRTLSDYVTEWVEDPVLYVDFNWVLRGGSNLAKVLDESLEEEKEQSATVTAIAASIMSDFMSSNVDVGAASIYDAAAIKNFASILTDPVAFGFNGTLRNVVLEGPSHLLCNQVRIATPADSNPFWQRYAYSLEPSGEQGPAFQVTALYADAVSSINAGPSNYSSALRLNLTMSSGDLAYTHALLVGRDVSRNISTSSADIPFRLLMQLASLSLFDLGTGGVVDNQAFVPSNPITRYFDSSVWPYSTGTVTTAAWLDSSITACVASLSDVIKIASGTARPIAGWDFSLWGSPNSNGIALVPIRQQDLSDGFTNIAWSLGHMAFPFLRSGVAGTIQDSAGTILYTSAGFSTSGTTANFNCFIPGPVAKILFVLTDIVLGGDVLLSIGLAGSLTYTANNVVSGVAASVGSEFINFGSEVSVTDTSTYYFNALLRWSRVCGNDEDFSSAMVATADVYGLSRPQVHMSGFTLSMAYRSNGAAFTDNTGTYGLLPAASRQLLGSVMVCASGCRSKTSAVLTTISTNNTPAMTIARHSPLIYIGMWAHWYSPTANLTYDLSSGLANLCARFPFMNLKMTLLHDTLRQRFGLSLYCAYNDFITNNPQLKFINKRIRDEYLDTLTSITGCHVYEPGWSVHSSTMDLAVLTANQHTCPFVRLSPVWLYKLFGDRVGAASDTLLSLDTSDYVTRNVAGVYYDILGYDPKAVMSSYDADYKYRTVLNIGSFYTASQNINAYYMADADGGIISPAVIGFQGPMQSSCMVNRWLPFAPNYQTIDNAELCVGTPLLKVRADLNMRGVRLTLVGNRALIVRGSVIRNVGVLVSVGKPMTDALYGDINCIDMTSLLPSGGRSFRRKNAISKY